MKAPQLQPPSRASEGVGSAWAAQPGSAWSQPARLEAWTLPARRGPSERRCTRDRKRSRSGRQRTRSRSKRKTRRRSWSRSPARSLARSPARPPPQQDSRVEAKYPTPSNAAREEIEIGNADLSSRVTRLVAGCLSTLPQSQLEGSEARELERQKFRRRLAQRQKLRQRQVRLGLKALIHPLLLFTQRASGELVLSVLCS